MTDFKVGDLVKKVRGSENLNLGYTGWVIRVFLGHLKGVEVPALYISGLDNGSPDKTKANFHGHLASNWEKVVPVGEDRCVSYKALKEEMA